MYYYVNGVLVHGPQTDLWGNVTGLRTNAMQKLTTEQSAVLSAYTGVLCGPFDAMHKYVERIMARPVFTAEMGDEKIAAEIKEQARADFIALVAE